MSYLTNPVKIKLQGCPKEVEEITRTLRKLLWVLEESETYHNVEQIEFVKRYLTVKRLEEAEVESNCLDLIS